MRGPLGRWYEKPIMHIAFPLSVAFVLLYAPAAIAQARAADTTFGRIAGEVRDSTRRPLEGARVFIQLVQHPDTPSDLYVIPRLAVTGPEGRFAFDSVSAGRYVIRVIMGSLGRRFDTVTVHRGQLTTWSIRMKEDVATRLYRERQHLVRASWQPTLSFTDEANDAPPCRREVGASSATVTLSADTIVVTGCEVFPEGWPRLVGRASRYGTDIVLDVVPADDGQMGNVVFERRYRAKIVVPERARYGLHVRLNITCELVTSQVVDLVEHTVRPTE
jgi:hypothetical protein